MDTALCVGGTRFIGRHTVEELLSRDYDVTTFTRGESGDPFADDPRVSNVRGDRNDRAALEAAAAEVDPDVVFDFVAYRPAHVRAATEVFADAGAYVYVSSGSAYARPDVPMREDGTPLHECTEEQARDESPETYGPRKAAGDRVVEDAARRGTNAVSVRPMLVYGPNDYTERFDYWLARVDEYDRVVVPGDGDSLLHRAYVEDVASALRIVAEDGEPGEAYNVADRRTVTLEGSLTLAAEALGTEVEAVHACERDLEAEGLASTDFPLFTPVPALASTAKLAALGWDSTPLDEAMARTVEEHRESDRDGRDLGPDRSVEVRVIERVSAGR